MPSPVFADTSKTSIPGRTAWMLRCAAGRVELDGRGQVHLGDDGHVGRVEDGRVLERLVLALGHREEDQPQVLAQVEGGRADQVADVLDEQEVELVAAASRPGPRATIVRLQVADRARW